jgi:hypothetical protein
MAEKQILSFKLDPQLEQVYYQQANACRIENIVLNDAMILSYDATSDRV